jgi:hypothetical protein
MFLANWEENERCFFAISPDATVLRPTRMGELPHKLLLLLLLLLLWIYNSVLWTTDLLFKSRSCEYVFI